MKKKIDIAKVPELTTSVGIHGSMRRGEVGGTWCLCFVVATVMAL